MLTLQRPRAQLAAAESAHVPVLLEETVAMLAPRDGGRYIDATVGGGGHTAAILAASAPSGQVLGLDRDPAAVVGATERFAPLAARARFVQADFASVRDAAAVHGWRQVDGVLFDLGFSSLQLAAPGRGFSFQRDEPLDMRLDPGAETPTAAALVATLPEEAIADLLWRFGEEPAARRIAREIERRRRTAPIVSTGQLHAAVWRAVGGRHGRAIDPATRTFQALRIAVNDELGQLERALPQALDVLSPGGRLAVISFHSLEDRIVKRFLAGAAASCSCPPDLPECRCGSQPTLRLLTRKPIVAGEAEVWRNSRARSAKLRAAEKLESRLRAGGREQKAS